MYPSQNKTPEERRASAAKGVATRRARREAKEAARLDALKYADGLREKISVLESRLAALERHEVMSAISQGLTRKAMLRDDEIAKAALPWKKASGIYFLLDGNEVVYIGQAVNVYSRIGQHANKRFDRFTFIPCAADALNVLESLYIHCLRPRLNGSQSSGAKCAPIALDALIRMVPSEFRRTHGALSKACDARLHKQ